MFNEQNLPIVGDEYYSEYSGAYYIVEYENNLYYFQGIGKDIRRCYVINFNRDYSYMILVRSSNNTKKRIDPRIIKARKEWGMEANPIFK